jgi:hypothetical protein
VGPGYNKLWNVRLHFVGAFALTHRLMKNWILIFGAIALLVGSGWLATRSRENAIGSFSAEPDSMQSTTGNDEQSSGSYRANLPPDFMHPTDDKGRRLLTEYGAVFVARGGATAPNVVVFKDESEVAGFQAKAGSVREVIGGISIELQPAAMKALRDAANEAAAAGLSITPRGTDAARRSYEDTVSLWASRVEPGLAHWTDNGRISSDEAKRIRALAPYEQVPEILKLEASGIYFAQDLSKSIVYSVAPPGSSQHLSMLALDLSEFDNSEVRSIMAKHGWFQTVISDLPHFTFLGATEQELPGLGLKKKTNGGRVFWIPAL